MVEDCKKKNPKKKEKKVKKTPVIVLALILTAFGVFMTGTASAQEAPLDTVTYDLSAGISYVGFPLMPDQDIYDIIPWLEGVAVWDRYGQYFIELPPHSNIFHFYVARCSGFFVRLSQPVRFQVVGHPIKCATVDISPGWNSITATKGNAYIYDPGNVITAIWGWTPAYWYQPVRDRYIMACTGAWVLATDGNVIAIGGNFMFPPNAPEQFYKPSDSNIPPLPWGLTAQDIANATGVKNTTVPGEFGLSQNYPNPFNPTTTIRFTVPETSEPVKLAVFGIDGREVARLVDGKISAGMHEVVFSAEGLPSGKYFCRLQAGSFSNVKQMTLLK